MILTLHDGRIVAITVQYHFMALAIDVIDRGGPSNKIFCQLQPMSTKVSPLSSSKKHFSCPLLLKRWSTLLLKVGVSYGW